MRYGRGNTGLYVLEADHLLVFVWNVIDFVQSEAAWCAGRSCDDLLTTSLLGHETPASALTDSGD